MDCMGKILLRCAISRGNDGIDTPAFSGGIRVTNLERTMAMNQVFSDFAWSDHEIDGSEELQAQIGKKRNDYWGFGRYLRQFERGFAQELSLHERGFALYL